MSAPLLVVQNLSKNYDGLLAVDCVSINFQTMEVHAIIGPNGAGKTTLINLLSGDLLPSLGRITFKDRNLTDMPSFAISQLGIGRSYQKTNIFPDFTCWQNCWLGAQSRLSTSMRFFKSAKNYAKIHQQTEQALALCGLEKHTDNLASEISYGEQRQLEISMMLATEPELLLLDEPLGGMGTSETQKMIKLIKQLARDRTIILIEHDMDAVFALADTLTVMVNGKVLATGTPDEIRKSQDVQNAYLGTEEENK
mgnify:CR=1 FL=1|jgi:branched-chain amino acid transport system ATP-binding protein